MARGIPLIPDDLDSVGAGGGGAAEPPAGHPAIRNLTDAPEKEVSPVASE